MIKKPAIVTSLSIAGIVLAGGAAVGANVGILSAADESPMGDLSAEADLATTAAPTTADTTTAASTPKAVPQRFAVESAGNVEVLREGGGLALGKLTPSAGWLANPGAVTPKTVEVSFASGDDTLVFTARLGDDDKITGAVKRPGQSAQPVDEGGGVAPAAPAAAEAPVAATSAPAAASGGGWDGEDGDHEDGDHEDGDHEDGDHEDEDHGSEDDD